jgi:hypothetical protein
MNERVRLIRRKLIDYTSESEEFKDFYLVIEGQKLTFSRAGETIEINIEEKS